MDYVNVTCWGSEVNYITQLHSSFKICDIGGELEEGGRVMEGGVGGMEGKEGKWEGRKEDGGRGRGAEGVGGGRENMEEGGGGEERVRFYASVLLIIDVHLNSVYS